MYLLPTKLVHNYVNSIHCLPTQSKKNGYLILLAPILERDGSLLRQLSDTPSDLPLFGDG